MAARKRLGLVAFALCGATLASAAFGCGDKLIAMGGGVGFDRILASRNPAHIILVLEPGTGLAAANDRFNLAGSLKLAGHEVLAVTDANDPQAKRIAETVDLILVDASRATQYAFRPVAGAAGPAILPIAYAAAATGPTVAAPGGACVTVASGRKGAQVLKAVELTLKLRRRGLPVPCDTNAKNQQA